MNFHRFIRPLVSCAALGAVALVLAAGCGSDAATLSAPHDSDGGIGGPSGDGSIGTDAAPSFDASLDANACQPGDVSDFKPVWKPPIPFHQGACDPATAAKFLSACLGASANAQECQKFKDPKGYPAYYKCAQCIATMDTADHYGPLIVHGGWVELNVAGCLANAMNDPTGVRCASSVEAARFCEIAACGANCPVTSEATLKSFDGCTQSADDTLCKSYIDPAVECLNKLPDSGDVPTCVENSFNDMADLFCAGPMDAGGAPD